MMYMPYNEFKELQESVNDLNFAELQYVLGLQTCKSKKDVVDLLLDYGRNVRMEEREKIFDKVSETEPCLYSLRRLEEILFDKIPKKKTHKKIVEFLFKTLYKPVTTKKVSTTIGSSWEKTRNELLELEKLGFVTCKYVKTKRSERKMWFINKHFYKTFSEV